MRVKRKEITAMVRMIAYSLMGCVSLRYTHTFLGWTRRQSEYLRDDGSRIGDIDL